MFVFTKTMREAIDAERLNHRRELVDLARRYGDALVQINALQRMFADWVTGKADGFTPEQFAALFYAHDDSWQAAVFNVMQSVIEAHHSSLPPPRYANEIRHHPGVPAGEAQWWHMAQHLDDRGWETIEAMFEHAKSKRGRS